MTSGAGREPSKDTTAPKIYIDLTDVFVHAIWHTTCGGIPRVQLEVAHALVRSNPHAVPFSLHRNMWLDLRPLMARSAGDSDRLFAILHEATAYMREYPRWRDPAHLLMFAKGYLGAFTNKLTARMPRLTGRDRLFVGGAFWMNRNIIQLCHSAVGRGAQLIVLFHDLIPLTQPQFTGHDFGAEYKEVLRLPAHFIVTTPFNRVELETVRAQIPAAQAYAAVSVVPLADEFPGARRGERVQPASRRLEALAARPFALCVGTIEIRKNHLRLLQVWEELALLLGEALPVLVVAGRRGWKAEAALDKLDAEPAKGAGKIIFIEAPEDAELRFLYSACLFTVFPSLFEGWGLPVGESFWFGKTCAASNTSSIPTVGRDLCVYFSPDDPEALSAAVRSLLDPQLRQSYEAKIAAAPLRSWAEVAADMERVIVQRG